MTVSYGELTIEWLGYATVRIEHAETTVYLDPGRYGVLTGDWVPDTDSGENHPPARDFRPEDGDVVCVTHRHHYDPDGIERVIADDGVLVAFEGMNTRQGRRDLPRLGDLSHEVVEVGQEDERVVADVPLWTVPAYNDPDGPRTAADGTPFHPEGRGCGYLLAVGDSRVFWTGDTDVLDGHENLDVDVLLPPIGGSFTMNREEAADLAASMSPGLVVPIHYNTFEALETDSRAFAADVAARGVPVALDEGE